MLARHDGLKTTKTKGPMEKDTPYLIAGKAPTHRRPDLPPVALPWPCWANATTWLADASEVRSHFGLATRQDPKPNSF